MFLCFCFVSCTWVSLWAQAERMAWHRREIGTEPCAVAQFVAEEYQLTDVQDVVFKYEYRKRLKYTACMCPPLALNYFHVTCSWWFQPCFLAECDIYFRLAFFELTYQFYTTQQLQWEVLRHYSKQVIHTSTMKPDKWQFVLSSFVLIFWFSTYVYLKAIKQMYVLVLGLDVLGNPFGLIRGLSEGVEAFFYEPYQVMISNKIIDKFNWVF